MRIGWSVPGLAVMIPLVALAAVQVAGEKEMILDGGSLGKVFFTHHIHQLVLGDCNSCHNLFPQNPGAIEKLKADKTISAKQVMNQCADCHKARVQAGEKSIPITCRGCHKK